MYVIPLIVFVFLGLVAVAWNPIFALIFFAIFMVGFFAVIGMRRRADEKLSAPRREPGREALSDDQDTGMWGEKRPS